MFVRDILNDPVNLVLVEEITRIAHEVGMAVVAEFVENEEIEMKLRELGVDYAQGYHFGRPALWKP